MYLVGNLSGGLEIPDINWLFMVLLLMILAISHFEAACRVKCNHNS